MGTLRTAVVAATLPPGQLEGQPKGKKDGPGVRGAAWELSEKHPKCSQQYRRSPVAFQVFRDRPCCRGDCGRTARVSASDFL